MEKGLAERVISKDYNLKVRLQARGYTTEDIEDNIKLIPKKPNVIIIYLKTNEITDSKTTKKKIKKVVQFIRGDS